MQTQQHSVNLRLTGIISGIIMALSGIGLFATGCESGLTCGDFEREFNGRCVCEFGYARVAGVCVPNTDTDGDLDADTNDETETDEAENALTHAATCADPQPLTLDKPLQADLSADAANAITHPCYAEDNSDMVWDGPDQVFAFTFTETMITTNRDIAVTVTPANDTSMAYAVYARFDSSGEATDLCDSADASYCLNYTDLLTAGNGSLTLLIGKPLMRPRDGDTIYIYVDSLGGDQSTPGAYSIVAEELLCVKDEDADRCVNDPTQPSLIESCQADGSWIADVTCSSDNICLLNESQQPVCATVPADGDLDTDIDEDPVDDTDVVDVVDVDDVVDDVDDTDTVDTDEAVTGELQVLQTVSLSNENATSEVTDLGFLTLGSGTRFIAIRENQERTVWYWNADFQNDFSAIAGTWVESYLYGGSGVKQTGYQVLAINTHFNPPEGSDLSRRIIGMNETRNYPTELNTVEALTVDFSDNVWLAGEGAFWKVDSNNTATKYTLEGHTNLKGISYASIGSSESLLLLSNNADDTESTVLQILLSDPGTIVNTQKLSVPVLSIAYGELGDYHLWGGLADISGGKHIAQFACLAFEPAQTSCSDE